MSGSRIARISVFAALVAAFGLTPAVNLPGMPVPITAQTLAVMLAGLMLVPSEAFLAVGLFVALVAAGLPLLSGGRGGLSVFSSPSAGFVLGFPVAAACVSAIAIGLRGQRSYEASTQVAMSFVACVLGGVVVLYCIGLPIGAALADVPSRFLILSMKFIPGDLAKAAAASLIAVTAFRAAPFLRPRAAGARA